MLTKFLSLHIHFNGTCIPEKRMEFCENLNVDVANDYPYADDIDWDDIHIIF